MSYPRGRGWPLVLVPVAICLTTPAAAQDPASGSRLVPVDDWTYEYVQRLRVRGYLQSLNPLVQPYRRMEIARGLAVLDPDTLPGAVAEWVRLLQAELALELDRLRGDASRHWGLEFLVGGRASTSQRLNPLRPLGEEDAWPRFTAAGWLESGPFAAETRLGGDVFLTFDPDGMDPGQRRGGRTDNAYVTAQFAFGRVSVGRFKNNWGFLGDNGLMVSDVATPYPQLAFELGTERVRLRSLLGELDTLSGQKRYIAAHRLDYAAGNLAISFGEATVYASSGAVPLLRYLNPVEFFFFDQENEPADVIPNLMLNAQVWYRTSSMHLHGSFVLDDLDFVPAQGVDRAPTRYALTIGVGWAPVAASHEARVSYKQVSSFAYRTFRAVDHYSFLGRGLGDNYADYDHLKIELRLATPVRGLLVTPAVEILRQGEGDFRDPMPSEAVFRGSPNLHLGVKETTYRLGLSGRYQPNRYVWVAWDLGQNFIRNAAHAPGDNTSKFAAVAELGASIDFPLRRPR